MEERSFFHVFHQDIDVIRVAEEAIHADNVGMVEEEGYLYLLDKLIDYQPHRFLGHFFDG